MATPVYVWHGSSQDDADATWNSATIAYLTLELALAAVDADGIVYVASEHSQTQESALTLGSTNGTLANPVTIISVNKDDSDAYLAMVDDAAPGSVATTGNYTITINKSDIYIGLTFNTGMDLSFYVQLGHQLMKNCLFKVTRTTIIGGALYYMFVMWENCIYERTSGDRNITIGYEATFIWRGGTYKHNGGSTIGNVFDLNNARDGTIDVSGVDFQDLDAGDYLVDTENIGWKIWFKRCKVPAALAGFISGTIAHQGYTAKFHSVSSSDIIYQLQENYYEGQINSDVATYYQATYDGTNEYSIKMVSLATAKEWVRPLRFKLAEIWADANPTLTVELNTDNVVLQNDEFWIEIEYPDSTTGALGGLDQTSRSATIVTAPANLTTSAVAWTEAFGTEKPQKIEETISGGQAGIHTVWACLGKPSTTVYVCPKITVS